MTRLTLVPGQLDSLEAARFDESRFAEHYRLSTERLRDSDDTSTEIRIQRLKTEDRSSGVYIYISASSVFHSFYSLNTIYSFILFSHKWCVSLVSSRNEDFILK